MTYTELPQSRMTEAELDQLETLLELDIFKGESLLLDEIQAIFCALISGPEPLAPSVWLPAVLGEAPNWQSPEQTQQVTELLLRFYNDVLAGMTSEEGLAPILYPVEEDSDELDFGAWADAYLYGTELGDPDWLDAAGEHAEDLSELLQPLFLLSGALKEDAESNGAVWLTPAEESRAMADAQNGLPDLIQDIYRFWRIKGQPVKTVRRDTPKVGRNDPCPCGSGKKFKQCCGA